MNRDDKFGDKLFGKSITPSPSDLERARLVEQIAHRCINDLRLNIHDKCPRCHGEECSFCEGYGYIYNPLGLVIRDKIIKALAEERRKRERLEKENEELEIELLHCKENLCLNLDEDLSKLRELSTEQLVSKAITGIFWRNKQIAALERRVKEIRRETLEEAAVIAQDHSPSEKATEVLRCNPKDAQRPYIDASTMNGYDWACDDIATSLRARMNQKEVDCG